MKKVLVVLGLLVFASCNKEDIFVPMPEEGFKEVSGFTDGVFVSVGNCLQDGEYYVRTTEDSLFIESQNGVQGFKRSVIKPRFLTVNNTFMADIMSKDTLHYVSFVNINYECKSVFVRK